MFSDGPLAVATAGDQVWVATGTYVPSVPLTADPRTATFELAGGIELFGGFDGTNDVRFSDVMGGWPGNGNLDLNPMFVSVSNLHLRPGSLCIDAANPNKILADVLDVDGHGDDLEPTPTDWLGRRRQVPWGLPDMGALERP